MIRIIQAEPFHAYNLAAKPHVYPRQREEIGSLHTAILRDPSVTFCSAEGKTLAIAGVTFLYPGVVEFWAVITDIPNGDKLKFHRAVQNKLNDFFKRNKIRRGHMYVRADYDQGVRWAEILGFKPEGVLPRYGAEDADYFIMGRVG